ncbi:sushi, von Willebrand factor type A, EGF and pentraxin domain-containing protein 1-like [Anneissia japonica]|uniref:sushi, von Willebrand factor type A, EGF and pentraxin domain-containing protein 1-like n=1 Tax=Anneissia japonica TaxID=1529436 RepID=UPI001425AC5A|nr:sushi, von Willebrand factor type A, EGF and pentraxin domain-containing protein 1-like [Anneissia japonica]
MFNECSCKRVVIIFCFLVILPIEAVSGDCSSSPPSFEHSTFTGGGSKEGDYAIYSCDSGYVLTGDQKYGVQFCESGKWVGENIECKCLQCPEPSAPAFGNFSSNSSDYMATISYSCYQGVNLEGNSERQCQGDGTWNGEAPNCTGSICNHTDDVVIGALCYSIRVEGKTWKDAKASCLSNGSSLAYIGDAESQNGIVHELTKRYGSEDHNYWIGLYEDMLWYWIVSDSQMIYSNWDSPSDAEEGKCCYMMNDTATWSSQHCGIKIGYICQFDETCPTFFNTGGKFEPYGPEEIDGNKYCFVFNPYANEERNWAKDKCLYRFLTHDGGTILEGKLAEILNKATQDYITSAIKSNHKLQGIDYWIGAEQKNANPRKWKWTNGFNLTYSSWGNIGYSIEPSHPSENCVDMFKIPYAYDWNDDDCSKTDTRYICSYDPWLHSEDFCGFPGGIPHGVAVTSIQSRYAIGDNVTYVCEAGYHFQGPSTITCIGKGQWFRDQPSCIAVNCSFPPPAIEFSMHTVVSSQYRGIVVYKCTSNLILIGYGVSVCLSNATWSHPEFTCEHTPTFLQTTLSKTDTATDRFTTYQQMTSLNETYPARSTTESISAQESYSFFTHELQSTEGADESSSISHSTDEVGLPTTTENRPSTNVAITIPEMETSSGKSNTLPLVTDSTYTVEADATDGVMTSMMQSATSVGGPLNKTTLLTTLTNESVNPSTMRPIELKTGKSHNQLEYK